MAAFIGFDLLFPAALALCAAALLGRGGREWLLALAGAVEGGVVLGQKAFSDVRPSGTFDNPNYAALVMVVGALVALDSAAASRRRLLPLAAAGIALLGIVATGSQSAFAALAAGTALLLWRLPRRWRLVPVAGLALLLLLPNPLSNRLVHYTSEDPHAFRRPMIWSMALEAWGEHPVTGLGPGGFIPWARTNNRPVETTPTRFGMRPETAHNQPLQTALDYGIPGLTLLALVFMLLASQLARQLRAGDRQAFAPAAVLAASLPAAALFPILESPPLLLFLALGLTLHRGPCDETFGATPSATGRILRIAVPTLLAVLLATEALHAVGARVRSIPLLTIAAVIPPQNPSRWQDLATIRAGNAPQGDRRAAGEALVYLSMAASLSPGDPGTLLRRADLLVSRINAGERDALLVLDLLRTLDAAASRDPLNPHIPFASGGIRLTIGRPDLARRDLARAVALEPNFLTARARLADSLDALGMAAEAGVERRTAAVLTTRWKDYAPRSPYERSILAIPPPAANRVREGMEE
jgi:hypothetical protein